MRTSVFSTLLHKKSVKKESGFTLLEVMVVIGIITVLSSILLGYSRENSKHILLASSINKVEAVLSRAQFLSIQSYAQTPSGDRNICAYGVRADTATREIFIFQVLRGKGECKDGFDQNKSELEEYIYETDDTRSEKLTGSLDKIVFRENGVTVGVLGGNESFEVVYTPPQPVVIINGDEDKNSGGIEIGTGDITIPILVTNDGKIEIGER